MQTYPNLKFSVSLKDRSIKTGLSNQQDKDKYRQKNGTQILKKKKLSYSQ